MNEPSGFRVSVPCWGPELATRVTVRCRRVGVGVVGQHAAPAAMLSVAVLGDVVGVVDGDRARRWRRGDGQGDGGGVGAAVAVGDGVGEGVGAVEVGVGGVGERAVGG